MDPPGLERKLRIRALRSSCITDAIQALAFTAAGIWAISSAAAIGAGLPLGEFILVRREEYSVHNVELQLAWLPAAFPLRKECYTLVRDGEGVVSVGLPTRCRLSTVSAATGIDLLQPRGASPTR
jgi:hypothetical protein